MRRLHHPDAARGFTLIELLITLVVVAVGMLGLAKLEAAAVAESGVSRIRSLMTYQAESLAAMMRANRNYWGGTTGAAPGFTLTAGATTITDNGGTNKMDTSKTTCVSTSTTTNFCTSAQLAYFDIVKTWLPNYTSQFPGGGATVACTVTANLPTTCDITLSWTEHTVGINSNSASASAAAGGTVSMVLHVQP
jgi:type IV pilus assembly protein PilV